MGYQTDHLVSRFEEALTIVRRLLREGRLDFTGTQYRVDGFELRPRGPRPSGPPILIGTLANRLRMLRLVAQHADIWNGWVAYDRNDADVVPPMRERVDAACHLHEGVGLAEAVLDDPDRTVRAASPGLDPMTGSPEELTVALRALATEGSATSRSS